MAVYLYRIVDGQTELLQLRRRGADAYAGTWQPIYGGILPGETAPQAAWREIREETGLAPAFMEQVEHVETFYFRPDDSVVLMPVFAAPAAGVILLDEEHDDHRWIPVEEADAAFMWRSQRDAVRALRELLERPAQTRDLLRIHNPGETHC